MKYVFETEGCSRCGGSGHYSFNPMYGTTCFKCHGTKVQLTRSGSKARQAFDAKKAEVASVDPMSLKVGDRIRYVTMSGKVIWATLLENPAMSETYSISTTPEGEVKRQYVSLKLKGVNYGVVEGTKVQKFPSPEQWEVIRNYMKKFKGCTMVETTAVA